MTRAKRAYRAGDLFGVPLPDGSFATARILLDVSAQCLEPKKIERSSPLKPFEGAVLVEVYDGIGATASPRVGHVIVPGVFISTRQLAATGKGRWSVVGHVEVDPAGVEFPEALLHADGRVGFVRGEIERVIDIDQSNLDKYRCRPAVVNPAAFVSTCLYYLDRKHLIGFNPELATLASSDLRFTPWRHEIYSFLREDADRSYRDWSNSLGLDLARFYS